MAQRPPIPLPRQHLLNACANKETNEYEIINVDYEPSLMKVPNITQKTNQLFKMSEKSAASQKDWELGSRPYHEVDFSSDTGALSGTIKKIDDPLEIEVPLTKQKTKTSRKYLITNFFSFLKNDRRKKPINTVYLENEELKSLTFDGPFNGKEFGNTQRQGHVTDEPPTYEEAIKNLTPHSLKEYRLRWQQNTRPTNFCKKNGGKLLRIDDSDESQRVYENFDWSMSSYHSDMNTDLLLPEKLHKDSKIQDTTCSNDDILLNSILEEFDPHNESENQLFSTKTSHLEWIAKMCSNFDVKNDFRYFNDYDKEKDEDIEIFC